MEEKIGFAEPRTRVNAATLASFSGRPVTLLGNVKQVCSCCNSLYVYRNCFISIKSNSNFTC